MDANSDQVVNGQCQAKTQFIDSLKFGDKVDDIFVLAEKKLSLKKDGEAYLSAVVSDKSGSINCVAWENVDQIASVAEPGEYIHVKATASEYRGTAQLVIEDIQPCAAENVNPADFIPCTRHNIDRMFERLVGISQKISCPWLKQLLQLFWEDADFVRKFKTSPAAKGMHHAYVGGLLEHTLSMAILVERIAGHYSGIDMDLLMTGAILHDIGKIREYQCRGRIDSTDEGRLLSHIVIGIGMIEDKIRMVNGFPDKTAMLLKHLVVSHHGVREFGSPEVPKTIEAILLNYIDDIDAKVNGIRDFIGKEPDSGSWTSFNKAMGRQFFKETRAETTQG